MGVEQYLVIVSGQRANICFDCANACGGCSWSEIDPETKRPRFEPVPGWKAYPVKRPTNQKKKEQIIKTYRIVACPQFVRG